MAESYDLNLLPPSEPVEPLPEHNALRSIDMRVLTPDEVATLAPIFEANGAMLPHPGESLFVGAVECGEVVGFIVLQLALHAEPMWIKEGYSAVFQRMIGAVEEQARKSGPRPVYVFCPAGRTTQLAQLCGMKIEPWVVLSKWVEGSGGQGVGAAQEPESAPEEIIQ